MLDDSSEESLLGVFSFLRFNQAFGFVRMGTGGVSIAFEGSAISLITSGGLAVSSIRGLAVSSIGAVSSTTSGCSTDCFMGVSGAFGAFGAGFGASFGFAAEVAFLDGLP